MKGKAWYLVPNWKLSLNGGQLEFGARCPGIAFGQALPQCSAVQCSAAQLPGSIPQSQPAFNSPQSSGCSSKNVSDIATFVDCGLQLPKSTTSRQSDLTGHCLRPRHRQRHSPVNGDSATRRDSAEEIGAEGGLATGENHKGQAKRCSVGM